MEKKLYIPTSSLNFNCIIANESISPGLLYQNRAFGMKRFVDIYNRKNANTIILTDFPAQFNRPPSDVEDHPMLIEVFFDEEEITAIGDGYYTIDKTLYITPYNTRFIFFNEQDRLTTESLSNHSLDVKLSRLYIPRMAVEQYSEKYNFPQITLPDTVSNLNSLTYDDRINRLKGMLYGYYIGAWLSSDKTEVERLNILLNVQNVFSATISSGKNKESELRELSKRWEQLYPLYEELQQVTMNNVESVLAILKRYGVRLPIENLGLSLYTKYLSEPTKEGEINPAMQWIGNKINVQLEKISGKRETESIDAAGILTNGSELISISATKELNIVKHWFNDVLLLEDTPAVASWNRMDLADRITDATSTLLGDEWEKCPQRTFLNKLRHHIGNGDALDVEWNNEALCSITAVILHGEEWDKMLRFMQRKGMYDYRLSFAFYGALTGYADLTRDFVDTICDDTPIGYFNQLYKELYGQLIGKDIMPFHQKIHQTEKRKETGFSLGETNTNNIKNDAPSYCPKKSQSEEIVDIIKLNAEEKSGKYEPYYSEIISKELTDWDAIRALKYKGNDGWKGLIDKCSKSRKKENNLGYQQSLFDGGVYFYNDQNCWDKIKDIVPSVNANKIKKDLKWFQEELQKGTNSKYYARVKRESNRDAIAIFCKLKDGSFGKEDAKYFPQDLRDKIKQRLLSLYCSND